mgnify:CR=1 FL=1
MLNIFNKASLYGNKMSQNTGTRCVETADDDFLWFQMEHQRVTYTENRNWTGPSDTSGPRIAILLRIGI